MALACSSEQERSTLIRRCTFCCNSYGHGGREGEARRGDADAFLVSLGGPLVGWGEALQFAAADERDAG